MSVWSFCPIQVKNKLSEVVLKNKGNQEDLLIYHNLWIDWIKDFSGCEKMKEWAPCNGIHDALINQISFVHNKFSKFYTFSTDYKFYKILLSSYNHEIIYPNNIDSIEPNSYILVSQPNHEGGITKWFNDLINQCYKTNSKIFLDCAFYGTTFDKFNTYNEVFDCVAFSLSKNFLLGGARAGIVFGQNLSPSLTIPISHHYTYNYFNSQAVEISKKILPNFEPTYVTKFAKKRQIEYCKNNNLTPADIWMWAFDEHQNKICVTPYIQNLIQEDLNNV